MSDDRWQRFCVVGQGGHARTKLIPAIEANGQQLVGLVTRKASGIAAVPTFATTTQAVAALPEDTVFVIASPPAVHCEQALVAIEAGRDVVVEKPPFVTVAEARAAIAAAERSGSLLVEGFMNRHTATHRHFVDECARERPAAIECTFTIPEAPTGTFRSEPAIGASNLYDIGSYFLAALLDAGLPLEGLSLDRVDEAGRPDRERVHLSGILAGVTVRAVIGVDAGYANRLRLARGDGSALEYEPFFYGRPGRRMIVRSSPAGGATEEGIDELNAFETMFAVPPREWRSSQPQRLAAMLELTRHLERLGRSLADLRREASRARTSN